MWPVMEPTPTVSIIVAAYNVASTVEATIASCLAQTYKNTDILVVNDGSTDTTRAVLDRFGSAIRVIDQKNTGLWGCRNTGLTNAKGSLIAWMDGDDICHPRRIELQVAALREVPSAGLACSDFSAFEDDGADYEASHIGTYYPVVDKLGGIGAIYAQRKTLAADAAGAGPVEMYWGNIYRTMLRGNVVHPPTVLMRRELVDAIGLCDPAFLYSSDYEYLVRASRATDVAYLAAPLLRYRRSRTQLSRRHGDAGLLQIDTATILAKALAADKTLDADTRRDVELLIADALLSAAQGAARVGEHGRAVRHLLSSLQHGFLPKQTLRTVARILTPNVLIHRVKASAGPSPRLARGIPKS